MKKTRKTTTIGKTRKTPETRTFPKYRDGMSLADYVSAYHASNASIHLTSVQYVGGNHA